MDLYIVIVCMCMSTVTTNARWTAHRGQVWRWRCLGSKGWGKRGSWGGTGEGNWSGSWTWTVERRTKAKEIETWKKKGCERYPKGPERWTPNVIGRKEREQRSQKRTETRTKGWKFLVCMLNRKKVGSCCLGVTCFSISICLRHLFKACLGFAFMCAHEFSLLFWHKVLRGWAWRRFAISCRNGWPGASTAFYKKISYQDKPLFIYSACMYRSWK